MTHISRLWIAIAALTAPASALAHPGHDHAGGSGLISGLAHPLTGADHLAIAALTVAIAYAAARFSSRYSRGVVAGAAALGLAHAGGHAFFGYAGLAFTASSMLGTVALYAIAAGAGLAVARARAPSATRR